MIQSRGNLKSPDVTMWRGNTTTWGNWSQMDLLGQWLGYGAIYRSQPWVNVLVNKIAHGIARLPLKVYERGDDDERTEARDKPYAQLLRRPNKLHDPYLFRLWTVSMVYIYGEAFWGKVRDAGGRPVELVPMHPMRINDEYVDGQIRWTYRGSERDLTIDRRDLVHFKLFNPDSLTRGLSPLEPLRATLENDAGARRANSALWRNGGRPSVILSHPGNLSSSAGERIAAQWKELHGGVDNWAKAAVLEEGMTVTPLPLNVEDLAYIGSRNLNKEECCAVYDIPPPAVQILDRATFSNITEQMRSLYRDSLAPKCSFLESTLEVELRDGTFGADAEPDFGEGQYAEHLMDEVLRGAFEARIPAIGQAIQTGQLTPNEARKIENRPPVAGGDRLLVNAALIELTETGATPVSGEVTPIDPNTMRSLMGRVARPNSLDDIDPDGLVIGLNGHSGLVLDTLADAKAAGETVAQFRARLAALGGTHA